ncbi:ATP-grasp domain-containing protein [Jiella flava]|uniref:ATP-grasp domain-containing protein n=1 Tax=Jiella flava TaxID=2816857 RepID=UPI001E60E849|nr:ATP-grasp domain-containing protein [Jiella flava]
MPGGASQTTAAAALGEVARNGHLTLSERRILVLSAGRRVGLIECFRRSAAALAMPLIVIACDMRPERSAACQIADAWHAVPRCDAPDYVDTLLAIVKEFRIDLVVPTIDPELFALAARRDEFAALGARVHVSAPEVVSVARDKHLTAAVLAAGGIPVPLTRQLGDADPRLCFPMMMKPSGGSASRGLQVIHRAADIPRKTAEPMVLQQLLNGPEFTTNIFVDQQGVLRSAVTHRRLSVRAGEVEKGRTDRDPRFWNLAEAIVAALPGARGVLCFQTIDDEDAGLCVFEINARFGGGYPLAHEAGAPFTQWLLEELCEIPCTAHDDWRGAVTMLRYDAAVFQG